MVLVTIIARCWFVYDYDKSKVIPTWGMILLFVIAFFPIINWFAFAIEFITLFVSIMIGDTKLKEPKTKFGKWLRS